MNYYFLALFLVISLYRYLGFAGFYGSLSGGLMSLVPMAMNTIKYIRMFISMITPEKKMSIEFLRGNILKVHYRAEPFDDDNLEDDETNNKSNKAKEDGYFLLKLNTDRKKWTKVEAITKISYQQGPVVIDEPEQVIVPESVVPEEIIPEEEIVPAIPETTVCDPDLQSDITAMANEDRDSSEEPSVNIEEITNETESANNGVAENNIIESTLVEQPEVNTVAEETVEPNFPDVGETKPLSIKKDRSRYMVGGKSSATSTSSNRLTRNRITNNRVAGKKVQSEDQPDPYELATYENYQKEDVTDFIRKVSGPSKDFLGFDLTPYDISKSYHCLIFHYPKHKTRIFLADDSFNL